MTALDLQSWLSLISTVAMVVALAFAGVQVRLANRSRHLRPHLRPRVRPQRSRAASMSLASASRVRRASPITSSDTFSVAIQ